MELLFEAKVRIESERVDDIGWMDGRDTEGFILLKDNESETELLAGDRNIEMEGEKNAFVADIGWVASDCEGPEVDDLSGSIKSGRHIPW